MKSATVIYYGRAGLLASVLAAYFSKLGLAFQCVGTVAELLRAVRAAARPLVILSSDDSPTDLIRLSRQIVPDPSSAFPHVFILYDGEPFDAQLEVITVITGKSKLPALSSQILACLRP